MSGTAAPTAPRPVDEQAGVADSPRRRGGEGSARRDALRNAWLAFWSSRLAVWVFGLYGLLAVGYRPGGGAPHTRAPLGDLGQLLFGASERWDGALYVSVALHSYGAGRTAAFFPLYPLAIRGLDAPLGSPLLAATAVSLLSFAVALYLLHRLSELELGRQHARTAVLAMAFFPTALFFSMAYAEALLLALALGAVYAARRGCWAWAGALGALASATHDSGVLVAIPIALLYLYGPRADRDRPATQRKATWRPLHRPGADMAWIALVPLGLAAFFAYMGVKYGDPLRSVHLNSAFWHRHFELLGGIIGVPHAMAHSLHTIATAPPGRLLPATNGPYRLAAANAIDAASLVFALLATVGAIRTLPVAYSAYAVAALVVFVSAPKPSEPLVSLPRYLLVLFPLQMWLARWLDERGRATAWLACSGLALGALSMQFATGRWVA